MICPHCGKEHSDGARFCPVKGVPIPESEVDPFATNIQKPTEDIPTTYQPIKEATEWVETEFRPRMVDDPQTTYQPPDPEVLRTVAGAPSVVREEKRNVVPKWVIFGSLGAVVLCVVVVIAAVLMLRSGAIETSLDLPAFLSPKDNDYYAYSSKDDEEEKNSEEESEDSETQDVDEGIAGVEKVDQEESENPTLAIPVSTPTITMTPEPTLTPTSTATPQPTITPTMPYYDLTYNEVDDAPMVFVPEGDFTMGSDPDIDPMFWGAEGPIHQVKLDSYWIYQFEVTNGMYQACVAERKCPLPQSYYSVIAEEYYGNPEFDDYPVIYVDYTRAASYCRWAGGRLPTEAEWEKAARGTDSRKYPWGDSSPNNNTANLCGSECARGDLRENAIDDGWKGPAPIGSYPAGVSPYGAYDMSGNVWEWTFDWFLATYYKLSDYENPIGPYSGEHRVIRGGSWSQKADGVRTVVRYAVRPDQSLDTLGFRCVVDVEP